MRTAGGVGSGKRKVLTRENECSTRTAGYKPPRGPSEPCAHGHGSTSMDESETETDPRRRIPTLLWVMIGAIVVLLFVGGVAWIGRPHPTHAVGPPAGSPADLSEALTAPPSRGLPAGPMSH
jgi:hypothetical protein